MNYVVLNEFVLIMFKMRLILHTDFANYIASCQMDTSNGQLTLDVSYLKIPSLVDCHSLPIKIII